MGHNPYAPPASAVSDAGARGALSIPAQVSRVLAMIGNGLFALLPVFYLLSGRRLELGTFLMSAYCLVLASCSAVVLFSRMPRRAYFLCAIVLNALVVFLFVYLVVGTKVSGARGVSAMLLLIAPALLNLVALITVRKARGGELR
jgi:hypothetical protein